MDYKDFPTCKVCGRNIHPSYLTDGECSFCRKQRLCGEGEHKSLRFVNDSKAFSCLHYYVCDTCGCKVEEDSSD